MSGEATNPYRSPDVGPPPVPPAYPYSRPFGRLVLTLAVTLGISTICFALGCVLMAADGKPVGPMVAVTALATWATVWLWRLGRRELAAGKATSATVAERRHLSAGAGRATR